MPLCYFDAGKNFCVDVDIKNAKVIGREEYLFDKPVRRGRPEGVPLVRFDHSLFKHNGRLLRATNHEPRFFPRAEGCSRRCRQFESVVAQRHLNPKRPANCGLRPAGPLAPNFDERRTTYAWLSGLIILQKNRRKFSSYYIHIFTINFIYNILK